jgi:hypothetical protein
MAKIVKKIRHYITTRELAKRLNISEHKLSADRSQGVGVPYYQFGCSVRYSLTDILAYEKARRVRTSDHAPDRRVKRRK